MPTTNDRKEFARRLSKLIGKYYNKSFTPMTVEVHGFDQTSWMVHPPRHFPSRVEISIHHETKAPWFLSLIFEHVEFLLDCETDTWVRKTDFPSANPFWDEMANASPSLRECLNGKHFEHGHMELLFDYIKTKPPC